MKLNVTFLGGSFGRKIVPDYVLQAVQASKAVGRPVKLIRSREEDMQHDVYRPNAGGRLRAVLDDAGYPLAIHARVAGQSLFGAVRKSWLDHTPEGDWDESMVDGIYNRRYRLPHFLVETVDTPLPIPVYFMRSVGSTAAVFFWELHQRARCAPASTSMPIGAISSPTMRWRRACSTRRRRRRLDARRPAGGTFRGAAYNCYVGRGGRFKTYVAQVAELARAGGEIRGQARVLRGRSRPRRQLQHARGADPGRHRFCADQYAQERHHLLERRRRSEQLPRLSAAAHRRDAGDRPDRAGE